MKRMKNAFTLAEVLITLAIIGVVAAIVMPSVMSNYQYKSIGVKLAKFVATVEASARPFVVNNDNFNSKNVTDFVNESFIFKTFDPSTTGSDANATDILSYPTVKTKLYTGTYAAQSGEATAPIAILKDGTSIQVYLDDTAFSNTEYTIGEDSGAKSQTIKHSEIVPVEKYGQPVFRINFDPKVQGLPSVNQKNFNFTVTELGYVFPHDKDLCAWQLFTEDFTTTSKSFESGTFCHTGTKTAVKAND